MNLPHRLVWAVDKLDPQPGDHVLEVGCGPGIAVDLICRRLVTGKVTAIDRSAHAIKVASARNTHHVSAGRAEFCVTSLDALDTSGETFDKVFAVNVNLFWVGPAIKDFAIINRLLKPDGPLFLFYEPPDPAKLTVLAAKLPDILSRHGYQSSVELTESLLCVTAHRPTEQEPSVPPRRPTT